MGRGIKPMASRERLRRALSPLFAGMPVATSGSLIFLECRPARMQPV
jgi:hypothetical protein